MYPKTVLSMLAISVLGVAPAMAADGGTLSDSERGFLIEQMEMSKKAFLASVSGLSEAQWKFKPAPAVWSVAECAEHIGRGLHFRGRAGGPEDARSGQAGTFDGGIRSDACGGGAGSEP